MKKTIMSLIIMSLLIVLFINNDVNIKTYADTSTNSAHIAYTAHCQKIGWQDAVTDGTMAGTTGRGLRLEAFQVRLSGVSGGVSYSSYVTGSGWQSTVYNGATSGTTGKQKEISAIKISLTGEAANQYDVYYQIHKSHSGWTGWVKNGVTVGTATTYKIESIQILLVKKGDAAPTAINYTTTVNAQYSAHVNKIGWQSYTSGVGVAGKTGEGTRIEAYKIKLATTPKNFGIEYSSFVEGSGWQNYVSNDQISGTTGQAKKTYGLKIRLTGYQSANYSVYYRTYTTKDGWGLWVRDGEISGNPSANDSIEAYQVRILLKSLNSPSNAIPITNTTPISLSYSTHVQTYGWMSYVQNSQVSGTSGEAKRLEAIKINLSGIDSSELGIKYSTHVQTYGWLDWVKDGEMSGTSGKAKRLEAIKIELTGNQAGNYDIYYRTHVQTYGWLDWVKNGEMSGTSGEAKRLEAIQILIIPAGTYLPGYIEPGVLKGIDVSHHNGQIDWKKVVNDGYSFVMVKVADGDEPAKNYKPQLQGACDSGMNVGVYCYSYAMSVEQAKIEARVTLDAIKGYNITYPVAFDLENPKAPFDQRTLSKETLTQMILAYRDIIEAAGYDFVLYINKSWLEDRVDYNTLYKNGVKVWLARYLSIDRGDYAFEGDGVNYSKIKFPKEMVVMWQHSETGKVNGINTNVDLNVSYGNLAQ